jgi:hypothetical protein
MWLAATVTLITLVVALALHERMHYPGGSTMSVKQYRVSAQAMRSISTPDQLVSPLGHSRSSTACPAARPSRPRTTTSTTCTPCTCSTTGTRELRQVRYASDSGRLGASDNQTLLFSPSAHGA